MKKSSILCNELYTQIQLSNTLASMEARGPPFLLNIYIFVTHNLSFASLTNEFQHNTFPFSDLVVKVGSHLQFAYKYLCL